MRERNSATDIELRLLLEAIYLRFHHDFRSYSMASLRRRVTAALPKMGCATISSLQERLLHEPSAFAQLLGHLTVQVSDLFRDPTFFLAFRELVVPELRTYPSLKIWVPGCSSGEEVYSLAIVLREEGLFDRSILYGTDINNEALVRAESGIYPTDRMAAFTKNYQLAGGKSSLSSYYTAAYDRAIFDRSLRSQIVFSDHSLATDGVFAEVQVISCRNVLIYFDDALQERTVDLFSRSLCRRGFLGLGSRETLTFSRYAGAFEELSREDKWYRRRS
ncbi:MAG TPA: CheR family methyltransferase [Polyangiaceae bacterium]